MNCCNHHDPDHENHSKKGHLSHLWMMVLCCGAPLLALLALFLLGARFPGVSALLLPLVPFLCPVLMVGMVPMMIWKGRRKNNDPPKRDEIGPGRDDE